MLDGNKKLYLRSLWGNDHFSLYVTDGRYLWLGDDILFPLPYLHLLSFSYKIWWTLASASFIESNMLIRGLEMDNFIRRSKAALITQDVSNKSFLFFFFFFCSSLIIDHISKKKYTYKVNQGEKLTDLEVTYLKWREQIWYLF